MVLKNDRSGVEAAYCCLYTQQRVEHLESTPSPADQAKNTKAHFIWGVSTRISIFGLEGRALLMHPSSTRPAVVFLAGDDEKSQCSLGIYHRRSEMSAELARMFTAMSFSGVTE
jgi:hypothetical protein